MEPQPQATLVRGNPAFPLDAKIGTETQAKECSYNTASGEFISDRGGLRVQGTTEYGYGVTVQGRKADDQKILISANKNHREDDVAVVDSNGGDIIPFNSTFARNIQQFVLGAIRLYLENGTCIGYTKIQQHVCARSDQELCVQCVRHNSLGAFGTLSGGQSLGERG